MELELGKVENRGKSGKEPNTAADLDAIVRHPQTDVTGRRARLQMGGEALRPGFGGGVVVEEFPDLSGDQLN